MNNIIYTYIIYDLYVSLLKFKVLIQYVTKELNIYEYFKDLIEKYVRFM